MHRNNQGFTLIELMIVIAILAVLMALAIPAYQDYVVRTKVSEAVYGIAWAKVAVSETYQTTGAVPDPASTGFTTTADSQYVASIDIAGDGSGAIAVTTRDTGAQPDVIVTLTPNLAQNEPITWTCEVAQGNPLHVPAECRN